MTFVVPYDGSEQSRYGIVRAAELAPRRVDVVAFAVVPRNNEDWARERDLLAADEPFDVDSVVARLRERVHDVDGDVALEYATVDRFAPTGKISHEIRAFARDAGASMVFVGSTNAGRIVSSLGSVGSHVATDDAYDVVVVRRRESVLA